MKVFTAHLIIVIEINPSTQAFNGLPPFRRVGHNDGPAFSIIPFNAHLLNSVTRRNTMSLVDFVFNGKPMGVPAKAATDVMALHGPITWDDVLDCGCEKMAIMRQSCGLFSAKCQETLS